MSESAPTEQAVTAATPSESAPSKRADRARSAGYRSRFGLLYLALAVVGGTAVGAFIVLLAEPDAAPAPRWSTWQPSGSDAARGKQIADHVAPRYRLANGDQLAFALGGPPTVAAGSSQGTGSIPVRVIAVRPDTSRGLAEEDDVAIVDATQSYQYILCGLGANCSIAGGVPSEQRHALLRREAVELALYTFKYVDAIDSVTVFLPPRPDGQAAPTAVFLTRGDISTELRKPLTQTFEPTTPRVGQLSGRELSTVNRITRPRLYGYEYQQAQDGSAVLILNPVVATS